MIIFPGHLFIKRPQQEIQAVKESIGQLYIMKMQLYLEIIRTYYMGGARYISEHQNEIMAKVKENLMSWNYFNPFEI